MLKLIKKSLFIAIAYGIFSAPAFASEAKIKQAVSAIVPPGVEVVVTPLENSGLFQVFVGTDVVFMTGDAKFLVMGNVIDMRTRENLTETAKTAMRQKSLAALDVSSMIEFPAKGEVKHRLTVFTDVDCPYCKKFHKEVPKLNEAGISVRYMAFPRSGIDTPSFKKMEAIWCADDKQKAMDEMKNQNKTPTSKACASPIKQHLAEVDKFGLSGTPALIFENGDLVPGYIPAEEILRGLGL